MIRITAISGSLRNGSLNQRTLDVLCRCVTDAGALVSTLDLGALDIPLYHADEEAADGQPPGVSRLREALQEAHGLIIACPEYNGFMTPVLLNAINWATRSSEGRPDLSPFSNKIVLIASASPGGFGGMRAAGHLRTMLSGIGCIVLPQSFAVPGAANAFAEDGGFASEDQNRRATQVVERLLEVAGKFV